MPCLALSYRTNLSALMPNLAFTLAWGLGLAQSAASHSATACSPRSRARSPLLPPPRSDGLSPLPTTDWTLLPRHTTPRISPVTPPPCCPTRRPEWRLFPCRLRAAPTGLLAITQTRRAGEDARRRNTVASTPNPARSFPAGPLTLSVAGQEPITCPRRGTPSPRRGHRSAARRRPNLKTWRQSRAG